MMVPITYSGELRKCDDSLCTRTLVEGTPAKIDLDDESVYCVPCAQCVEYHKRKAQERQEKGVTLDGDNH